MKIWNTYIIRTTILLYWNLEEILYRFIFLRKLLLRYNHRKNSQDRVWVERYLHRILRRENNRYVYELILIYHEYHPMLNKKSNKECKDF